MRDHDSSTFDALAEQLSRRMAAGFSRRSFFGSLGKASVTLAGAGAIGLIDADRVQAAYCGGHTVSTSCSNLTGNNDCPANTCGCGYWRICDTACNNAKVWSDCCAQYSCTCHCTSDNWPTCCFTKEWSQGCGTLNASKVICRRWYCSTGC
jgi:hypothetical protein